MKLNTILTKKEDIIKEGNRILLKIKKQMENNGSDDDTSSAELTENERDFLLRNDLAVDFECPAIWLYLAVKTSLHYMQ